MNLAEERIALARQALLADGYFTEDQVGDDIAPRIAERLAAAKIRKHRLARAERRIAMLEGRVHDLETMIRLLRARELERYGE